MGYAKVQAKIKEMAVLGMKTLGRVVGRCRGEDILLMLGV